MGSTLPITYTTIGDYADDFVTPIQASSTPTAFRGGLSPMQQFTGGLSQLFGGTDVNGTPASSMFGTGGSAGGMSNFQMGNAGLQTLASAMAAFNGYKQVQLAKQQLAFQKDSFNKQYAAQRGLVNSQLSDRQTRRVNEANANGYSGTTSVADYMDQYGVK